MKANNSVTSMQAGYPIHRPLAPSLNSVVLVIRTPHSVMTNSWFQTKLMTAPMKKITIPMLIIMVTMMMTRMVMMVKAEPWTYLKNNFYLETGE